MTRFETAVEPTKGRFGIPLQRRLGRLVDAAGPFSWQQPQSLPHLHGHRRVARLVEREGPRLADLTRHPDQAGIHQLRLQLDGGSPRLCRPKAESDSLMGNGAGAPEQVAG